MTTLGTPYAAGATRVLLLGSGELGKEVTIELTRLGCEVIAVDRYDNAPAMQVAHRRHVINMLDAAGIVDDRPAPAGCSMPGVASGRSLRIVMRR